MQFQPSKISYLGDPPFSKEGEHPLVGMPYQAGAGTYTFWPDGSVDLLSKGKTTKLPAGSLKAKNALREAKASAVAGARKEQLLDVAREGFSIGKDLIDARRLKHEEELERQKASLAQTQEFSRQMMAKSMGIDLDGDDKTIYYVLGGLGALALLGGLFIVLKKK